MRKNKSSVNMASLTLSSRLLILLFSLQGIDPNTVIYLLLPDMHCLFSYRIVAEMATDDITIHQKQLSFDKEKAINFCYVKRKYGRFDRETTDPGCISVNFLFFILPNSSVASINKTGQESGKQNPSYC